MSDGRIHFPYSAAIALVFIQVASISDIVHAEYAGMMYYIDRPKLALDLSYRFESEERTGPFITSKNSSHILNERFDIQTEGFVYHPALFLYTLRISPEWQQSLDQPDSGSERSSDTFLLGYALDMTLLQDKPYTINLFARKQRSVLTSSLATTSETESDTYGATLNLKYRVLPTILSYTHITLDQTGFYDSHEIRDEVRLNMRHKRPSNETSLNASWLIMDRNAIGSTIQTENVFGNLQNLYKLTQDNRVLLNSVLTFRQSESDLLNASGVSLSETLNWRHTKRFSTYYNLIHTHDTNDNSSIDRTSVSAGLSHSLYENLITTATASASTGSDGEDNFGGNVNFNYQRRIPWGMIYASLGQDYRVTTRSIGEVFVSVINESHALSTSDITFLDNKNVDLSTVVVTSPDGSIIYTRDIDYTLDLIGTSVRISRTPFGAITDGQSVLVSYTYLSNPAFDSATYGQSYGLGFYLWSAWRINYRYSHSQQDFLGGIRPDVLNEDTRHTLDTDLKWKWSTTRFLYEDTDSASGVSLSRWRLDENLAFRPLDNTFFSVSGYVGQTTFKETNSEENFYGARADLQWKVNNWSRARTEAFYGEIDGTSINTVDKGLAARWDWFYGIWTGDIAYRFLNQEDLNNGQSRNRHSIYFTIRRSLY